MSYGYKHCISSLRKLENLDKQKLRKEKYYIPSTGDYL